MAAEPGRSQGVRWLPAVGWLAAYDRRGLRGDVVAGVTVAAYVLPAALGYASLAGLPPEAGLYACLSSGLVFWLLCSSRHTIITITSAISLLIGSSLGPLAHGDTARYAALASATALLVGGLALLAWLFRAGVIVNFVSETVLTGFKAGVALVISSTQLPKLFGIKGGEGSFWERARDFLAHAREANPAALATGLGALAVLILGRRFLKNRPVGLVVIIAGIVVAGQAGLAARGVKLLGEIPRGLPGIGLPALGWHDVHELLPLAMACFLLAAVETVAIGRMFGLKHRHRLDSNQEFLALAGANLAAGVGHGLPVSGGMSQSLVNEGGGARTPLSGFLAALLVLLVTFRFSGPLRDLPQPVLAAIVLMAVASLFKLEDFRHLWRFRHGELAIALAALLGVLSEGLLRGVVIGGIISVLVLLTRASRPHVAVLGRVPGTQRFGDVEHNPENELLPGVLVFRVDASLLYFNVQHARDQFMERLLAQVPPVELAVWSLGTTPGCDLAGAEMLAQLHADLAARGVTLALAEARGPLRRSLHTAGLERHFGPITENMAIDRVVADWHDRRAATGPAARAGGAHAET